MNKSADPRCYNVGVHQWVIYGGVFALGFAADLLNVAWHRARESGSVWRTAGLSMCLEALTWIPVLLFVYADDPIVALAAVIASGAGTAAGMRRG